MRIAGNFFSVSFHSIRRFFSMNLGVLFLLLLLLLSYSYSVWIIYMYVYRYVSLYSDHFAEKLGRICLNMKFGECCECNKGRENDVKSKEKKTKDLNFFVVRSLCGKQDSN